ncbi:unnamed protein product [Parajaminaea phylloscopi]
MPRAGSRAQSLQLPKLHELPQHLIALGQKALSAVGALGVKGKIICAIIVAAHLAVATALVRLGPHGVLEHLSQFSTFFAQSTFGPLILICIITLLSFPPTFGYGTSITLCGLAFGSPMASPGNSLFYAWFVAASGCLIGSLTAFLVCRHALHRPGNQWVWITRIREGREWKAMEKAVERQGWRMIILIRFCPFPFVYSNLFFASLRPSVVPVHFFVLATLATTPKLLLHVFVGAQTFEAIQAGRHPGGDSPAGPSGWIKLLYIVAASGLGALTSWYIYHETKKSLESYVDEEEEEEALVAGEEGREHGSSQQARHAVEGRSNNGLAPPRRRQSRDPSPAAPDDQHESWGWSDDEDADDGRRRPRQEREQQYGPGPKVDSLIKSDASTASSNSSDEGDTRSRAAGKTRPLRSHPSASELAGAKSRMD